MPRRFVALFVAGTVAAMSGQAPGGVDIAERVVKLTRASSWRQVAAIPVGFRTFHPQGMAKVGDTFIVSSVEVTTPTERYAAPVDGYDRSAGAGVGHLFRMDAQGRLMSQATIGEASIYHPGGIDFDGRHVWVPVAEYRRDSRSIIYRVDPVTLEATEVLRSGDHIGGVVFDTDTRTLHGVSWGSRRFYRWNVGADGRVASAGESAASMRVLNPSHYIDYQDCAFAGRQSMLCTGLADIRQPGGPAIRLGGLDLVSLADGRPLHQVPVPLWTPAGRPMTQNPAWFESTATGLRAYFIPDDDESTLYVYEVEP
jgi:acyl-CoA-binding protein